MSSVRSPDDGARDERQRFKGTAIWTKGFPEIFSALCDMYNRVRTRRCLSKSTLSFSPPRIARSRCENINRKDDTSCSGRVSQIAVEYDSIDRARGHQQCDQHRIHSGGIHRHLSAFRIVLPVQAYWNRKPRTVTGFLFCADTCGRQQNRVRSKAASGRSEAAATAPESAPEPTESRIGGPPEPCDQLPLRESPRPP